MYATSVRIASGAAGAAIGYVASADAGANLGPSGALGAAGVCTAAGGGAWALGRHGNGWLVSGPDLARLRPTALPLLLASAGAMIGLGVAMLHDRALGQDETDFTTHNRLRLEQDLATRTSIVERESSELEARSRAQLEQGRLGAEGTVGEGRYAQPGSIDAVVDSLLARYGTDEGLIEVGARHYVGANVFDVDALVRELTGDSDGAIGRDRLRRFVATEIDTRGEPGRVSYRELLDWQLGPVGERRVGPGSSVGQEDEG